jgi:hypothetical protein
MTRQMKPSADHPMTAAQALNRRLRPVASVVTVIVAASIPLSLVGGYFAIPERDAGTVGF